MGAVGSLSLLCVITWDNPGGLTIHAAYNQVGGVILPALGEQTGVRTDRGHLPAVWDRRADSGARGCMLTYSPLELLPAPGQVLGLVPHQVQDSASHLLLECPPIPTDAQAADEGRGHATGSAGGPSGPTYPTPDQPATHPRSLSKSLGR